MGESSPFFGLGLKARPCIHPFILKQVFLLSHANKSLYPSRFSRSYVQRCPFLRYTSKTEVHLYFSVGVVRLFA